MCSQISIDNKFIRDKNLTQYRCWNCNHEWVEVKGNVYCKQCGELQ